MRRSRQLRAVWLPLALVLGSGCSVLLDPDALAPAVIAGGGPDGGDAQGCGDRRADCNGLVSDGCETDLWADDPANCGRCGTRCDVCSGGTCLTTVAEVASLSRVAASESAVFWSNGQSIGAAAVFPGPERYPELATRGPVQHLVARDLRAFWMTSNGALETGHAGRGAVTLLKDLVDPGTFDESDGEVSYAIQVRPGDPSGEVRRCRPDGSFTRCDDLGLVASAVSAPGAVLADGASTWWFRDDGPSPSRYELSIGAIGQAPQSRSVSVGEPPVGLLRSEGRLYFASGVALHQVNEGPGSTIVCADVAPAGRSGRVRALAASRTRLYWLFEGSDGGPSRVESMALGAVSCGARTLHYEGAAVDMAAGGGAVFVADAARQRLLRFEAP
ncbi:MAG: hypothetical protein ACK4N5_13060 [Myxococcales bacterium]